MRDDWRLVTVESIAGSGPNALSTGPFGSSISAKFFRNSGVPVIRGSNLSGQIETRLREEGLVYVSEAKASEFQRSIVTKGDLVFTCWGSVDQVGLVDKRARHTRYVISNKQMKLTPDLGQADSLFLYYAFSTPLMRKQILSQSIGSSVPGFNLGQLRSMKILLPPLEEQSAIALVLGSLDDKIDLNRRMNESLESMARALYKSWFIDFDPVVAKSSGKRPFGMDDATAALFPDRFVDSNSEPIPDGWVIHKVNDFGDVVDCLHSRKPEAVSDGFLLLQTYNVGDNGWIDLSQPYYVSREDYEVWSSRIEVQPGDLVITKTGRVGSVAQVPIGVYAALGRNLVALRSKSKCMPPSMLRDAFLSSYATTEIDRLTNFGTVLASLHVKSIEQIRFPVPNQAVASAYDKRVRPWQELIQFNRRESQTLAQLRDLLLPGLMSGEIRIKDAEKAVQEVL